MSLADLAAAVGDGIYSVLSTDSVLAALGRVAAVTVAAELPRDKRVPKPYVLVGERSLLGTGWAMTVEGAQAVVVVNCWSEFAGPEEAQDLLGRIRTLLTRDSTGGVGRWAATVGVRVFPGSLVCEDERTFPEDDPDMPTRRLFHGVQRWVADVEAA